ncbi:Uncharacterised protein [Klebsiella pneumoniae]|nr:Uncharacterised protein [Klebsiella pneumoniae]
MMSLWDALRMNMMISYQELVRTFPNKPQGAADVFLDCYVVIPRCCRYFTGLIAPNDSLIRFSLYQRSYQGHSLCNLTIVVTQCQ